MSWFFDQLIPFTYAKVYRAATMCQAICWGIGEYDRLLTWRNLQNIEGDRHGNGLLKCKAVRARRKLSLPAPWPHLSISGSASMFGCGSIYWISGHTSSVQTLSPGLAQTPSQDISPNDISGLVHWHNDSCEECSVPERSTNSVIHRLAQSPLPQHRF